MAADPLVELTSAPAAIGRPTATARKLVGASVSNNTRRAYAGALRQLDNWLDGRRLDDAALAAYLAELHDAGRAASSAATAVAAARFRAKLAGNPSPAGEATARVLAGYRRTAAARGRGQARPFTAEDLAAVLATCHRPRRRGRGIESDQVAAERGRVDAVIAGLLFMGGLRRSEVAALRWADVEDAGDGVLVAVRTSKTNQAGERADVRYLKNGPARAVRALRAALSPEPADRVVPLSPQMVGLRFTAAAVAAGLERRVTAHSGRVGLASELTSRGASTTAVMLAGNWKSARMVAHYSAGATAERGAVARYL
jgi:integrase